jgi:anti-sigma factor ChrR (cupin superfamily)
MNHPQSDELLLFASGELEELRLVEVASHLATCATCRDVLTQIEGSLVALERAMPRPGRALKRPVVWAGVALGAAAVLALVFIRQPGQSSTRPGWSPTRTWSATAGYMAGGALVDIDAQLTRLEQESFYGRP